MTELNAKMAALMAQAMAQPQSLDSALRDLNRARAEHAAACGTYSAAEDRKASADELRKIEKEQMQPTSDGVIEAEQAVLVAPAKDARDMVKKVNALLEEAMSPETVEALKSQMDEAMAEPEDPVVEACRQWLDLDRYLNSRSVFPHGEPEPPEWGEIYERSSELLRAIECTTPQSIMGVALMLSVMWRSQGPSIRPGCDGWEDELNTPDMRLFSRVRRGAYALAGIRE